MPRLSRGAVIDEFVGSSLNCSNPSGCQLPDEANRKHFMNGYFDHNATTPLSGAARDAWLAAQADAWQNPSGLYRGAGRVKRLIGEAREAFGAILGCDPQRIIFTSGATEGCNALMAHEAAKSNRSARVFTSAIEHPAVAEAARKHFGSAGVGELEVNASGILDLDLAQRVIDSEKPALVSVMAANNETGVLQPWRELAAFCRKRSIRFHCDAAQWVGKLPADGFGSCDWVTLSGHKFGGPKGVGLLVVPGDTSHPLALQAGGPQESGHRGGTESYPDIAAMLAALQCPGECGSPAARDALEDALCAASPGTRVIGAAASRLSNTSMVVMPAYPNLKWLTRLEMPHRHRRHARLGCGEVAEIRRLQPACGRFRGACRSPAGESREGRLRADGRGRGPATTDGYLRPLAHPAVGHRQHHHLVDPHLQAPGAPFPPIHEWRRIRVMVQAPFWHHCDLQ